MPEHISGRVSLALSWVCPQSHKYLVGWGLGPVDCLTTKLQSVCLFSFSGSHGAGRAVWHLPLPCAVVQAALSFLLLLSETWKEKQSTLFWVEGNVLFNPKGRFSFFSISLEKTWSNAISILPKPILGGRWGSRRLT